MKTIDAIAAFHAFEHIGKHGKSMPLKFAYAAAKNRRKLGELFEVYEKSRMALLEKFGEKAEDGSLVKDGVGNVKLVDSAAFKEAFTAINEEDVDVGLHKLAIADFPPEMDLGVMEALLPMVQEEAGAAA